MSQSARIFSLSIDEPFPPELRGLAVSIGNFDGVHLGHVALVDELRQVAKALNVPATVVTFDPHPLRLLAPERFMPQLTTAEHRAEQLLRVGADTVVILRTTNELLQLHANDFLQRLLIDRLTAKAIIEGFNFGFGKDRGGTTKSLEAWSKDHGLTCRIVNAKLGENGEPVSSSRVRAALDAGDVTAAARLLGRPYRLCGKVVTGDRRGATIGFPTANLGGIQTVIPGNGVYAVRVGCKFGNYIGAANVGPNPTFGVTARKVEVHVLDFEGDLYDCEMTIDFVARIRDTRQFASKEDLVRQLHRDVQAARDAANAH